MQEIDVVGISLWECAGLLEKLVGKADPVQINAICTNLGTFLNEIKQANQQYLKE